MVALDWLELKKRDINEAVTIPPAAMAFPQNPIGFQAGDQASIRDLLYAALMQSDDIAAYSLAMHVGPGPAALDAGRDPDAGICGADECPRPGKLGRGSGLFGERHGSSTDQ